jgi:prephenate dehydrogenase
MKLAEAHVTIVGLGLIGGSMAAGLRGRCAELVGVDLDPETRRLAREEAFIDRSESDLRAGLQGCDLAILAVPVGEILSILGRMGVDLPAPTCVFDVGSTKAEIVAAMDRLPAEVDPLGGHPLCGKEISGLSAAEAYLFRDKAFVVAPLERSSAGVRGLADEIIRALGARAIEMDAVEHDRLLAATSHLPYLMAVTLVACVGDMAESDPRIWELTASGFRDSTRLTGSDIRMMMDILSTNIANIREAVQAAQSILGRIGTALEEGDLAEIEARMREARDRRMLLEERRASSIREGA